MAPRLQTTLDFNTKGGWILARGYDSYHRLAVKRKALGIKFRELVRISAQRPLDSVRQTSLPEFGGGRLQKDRWPFAQQFPIHRLGECAAAECDHAVALERIGQEIAKGGGFGQTKAGFASLPKNHRDSFLLARLDLGIQVHKIPA